MAASSPPRPPPISPPSRRSCDLGTATVDYDRNGLRAEFRIPARHVAEPRKAGPAEVRFPRSQPGHPVEPPPRVLDGHDILLVEDSLIIALDAEDVAQRLGAKSIATGATVDGALDIIHDARPSVAMLDINLGSSTSFPIADRLHELGIPFLFATGYGEQAQIPLEHHGRLIVQKPYTLENVARAMHQLLGG